MLVVDSEIVGIHRTDFRLSQGHALLLERYARVVNPVSESSDS